MSTLAEHIRADIHVPHQVIYRGVSIPVTAPPSPGRTGTVLPRNDGTREKGHVTVRTLLQTSYEAQTIASKTDTITCQNHFKTDHGQERHQSPVQFTRLMILIMNMRLIRNVDTQLKEIKIQHYLIHIRAAYTKSMRSTPKRDYLKGRTTTI